MPDKLLSQLTDADIEAARRHLEDLLIEFRDIGLSLAPGPAYGHGLVVKARDGEASSVIRLGTGEAIGIALKAILEA